MISILFRGRADDRPQLVGELYDLGTRGIVEEDEAFRAFFDNSADLSQLRHRYAALILDVRSETEQPSPDFSRDNWDPVFVGNRFVIAPSWVALESTGRIRLAIDASSAFGTGRHESTQLAICALERYVAPGMTVIDIGCGSGILSLAAKALGASTVIACDVHPNAVRSASQQLPASLFLGTSDAIRDACAHLVIANISRPVIDALTHDIHRIAKPGALVILGGFLEGNQPSGFSPIEQTEFEGWLCWVCRAQPPSSVTGNQQHRIRSDAEHWW